VFANVALIASYAAQIVELAARARLPAIYPGREFVDAGGLVSYGGSVPEMYRRAAIPTVTARAWTASSS
jgi:putative ABC transport system substrate-binding protein